MKDLRADRYFTLTPDGDNDDIPTGVKVAIRQAVLKFLSATAKDMNI